LDKTELIWTSEFLTVADIARVLKLNQQTVRNWIDQGHLRAVRVGRRVRLRRSALDAFVAAGEAPATEADDEPGSAKSDLNADHWARLGAALAEASAALADKDRAMLSQLSVLLQTLPGASRTHYATRRDQSDGPSRLIGRWVVESRRRQTRLSIDSRHRRCSVSIETEQSPVRVSRRHAPAAAFSPFRHSLNGVRAAPLANSGSSC
jgi:excisionase family DNA binding protein